MCCQQFGFHPNFLRCDRQDMLNYKVLKDETPCAVAVSKGVAGERIVSGEQRDTGEALAPAESSLLETFLLPQEITYFTQLRLHLSCRIVDRSADGPRTAEPRPARSLLWQKSCLVRRSDILLLRQLLQASVMECSVKMEWRCAKADLCTGRLKKMECSVRIDAKRLTVDEDQKLVNWPSKLCTARI